MWIRERFPEVIFESITPFDLWSSILITMYALVLLKETCIKIFFSKIVAPANGIKPDLGLWGESLVSNPSDHEGDIWKIA